MKRKLLAVLLAVLMVLSVLPTVVVPKTSVAETAMPHEQTWSGTTPHDQIEGGAILHCFNWTYNEIKAALPDIAAAGYVAVQTSPVQQGKDYDASYMDSKGQWWKLYQPLGLRIAPDVDGVPTSFLGTKDELTALCDEAEALGLYVIVDIVVNHLANKTGGGYYVDGEVNLSEQVDEEYQDHPEYFHHNTDGVNDGSRYNMTQNQMGMPDLNTSNQYIQEQVYALLKECVDCGVDGFRFDAAKHIELPGDPDASSDFWPAILNGDDTDGDIVGIRPYAGAENLFIYGESLSGNAGESWVDEFTNNYMALTDSNYGGRMRDALNGTNAGMLGDGTYVRCSNAAGNVVWVESHDTYEDGASSGIESDKVVRAWAIVGARANSTALYLARPNEIMGKASTDTAWKSPAVAAVNAFKSYYDGTREYLHQNYENKVAWIEREGDAYKAPGVVISKLDGAGAVSLELEWMVDGYYEDEITGNVFTVSNGVITGNVGPTGVAVVYHGVDNPYYITANKIYFIPTGWWLNDGAQFGMFLFNKEEGIGENQYVPLEDDDEDGVYEGEVPDPEGSEHWGYVSFMRMDPEFPMLWDGVWDQVANLVNDPGTNCFTISAPEGSSEATGTWSYYGPITADPIYFVPTGWWLNDGARFEMWVFNSNGGMFVSLTDADNDGTYEGALPEGNWTGVIFVRMDPNGSEHDWDSKWNQTDNLVPDPGTNCFTITAGSSAGTWSVYGGTPNPDAGYYLVGSMTGWAIVPEYKMTQTGAETEEYMIETELIRTSSFHSQVKAVYSPDGVTKQTWYPDGFDNNYGDYDGELTVSGVYKIYFRPNYDGGSDWHDNCLYAEQSKYFVTVSDADKNGVVTVNKDTAAPGDTVTVTVTPHEGYMLDTLVYRYETEPDTMNFESVAIENGSFTMPAYNVTVIATFVTQWSWLQQQLEEDGNTIVLDRDIVCVDQDEGPLTVPEDIYVTLDLNGHTVDRNLTEPTENGNVITVMGELTLFDSSTEQTGVITGGNNLKDGGGVLVRGEEAFGDEGSFIMEGGTITGNTARDGGGVSVGCWDTDTWDFFYGYFEMYGGVITGNMAATEEQYYGYGGGVYVSEGQFCLFGGEISENHSDLYGGGVYVVFGMSSAPFVVSGAPVVRDNTCGDVPETDNVAIEHWADSCVIYVEDDGLAPEASIGVNVYTIANYDTNEKILCLEPFTSGLTNGGDASNFVSDFAGYTVILNEDGEAMLAESATAEPSFGTHSLVLDGQIGVKFYMNLDCLTEEEKAASYMTFTISGKGTVSSDPVTFDAGNTNAKSTLYGFTCYVNAIQMADTITATFHYGEEQTISEDYSIMQYYGTFKDYANEFDVETRNLVRALVCYGYCTQQFLEEAKNLPLGYDEASYAPIELPEELEETVASYDHASIADMIEEDSLLFKINNMNDENIKGISFSVAFDSETKLTVTFKPDPSYTGIATCRIDNENEADMQKVRGRFVAEVPNIPAHKLGEMHLIWAYTGDNCYAQVSIESTVIEASPMSYVYLMLTQGSDRAKDCGAALYTYWQAAQAFKEKYSSK